MSVNVSQEVANAFKIVIGYLQQFIETPTVQTPIIQTTIQSIDNITIKPRSCYYCSETSPKSRNKYWKWCYNYDLEDNVLCVKCWERLRPKSEKQIMSRRKVQKNALTKLRDVVYKNISTKYHNNIPHCSECPVSNINHLQLHHIHKDGYVDRKRFKNSYSTMLRYYRDHPEEALEKLEFRCSNCNLRKD